MSNKKSTNTTANEQQQPIGVMLRHARTGNISFEIFTALENLSKEGWNPVLEFKVSMNNFELPSEGGKSTDNNQVDSKYYKVILDMEVTAKTPIAKGVSGSDETEEQKNSRRIFTAQVTQEGIFNLINLSGNKKDLALNTLCLETIFPYLASNISQIVSNAGYPPVYLQPMNFAQIYKQKLAQEKEKQTETTT